MSLRPLGDKVVIKVKAEEVKTVGGIVLPGSAQEKPQQGKVVAVGTGEIIDGKKVPLDVKVDDEVIYSKYSGNEVKIGDEEFLIIRQADILAIVE
ncbi:co-chaperone GroES [Acetobacterium wieringae]|uniref:Co-chaperonin GroES n=1 Tax=Acetobacterium wieringae TaxID=52694 RepID=A0A1F2PE24_9FIRM|nr:MULTISPECIES: co-chaperone GroES [Acetobacterium]MEA4806446.1 co-chaperone GroES [Acetobacterium wieringae]OFV69669.1 10 kDa chaperonin [Acetobacterium wieringae]OXS27459.1 MAG: co-chaperone GroES [Acetobacterium sp. MES1]TYC84126.1 co-chaperone GroES [Acetobacterium wieringae]URN85775.1 co-chaperone GroES [Acetobacterium wieringae]